MKFVKTRRNEHVERTADNRLIKLARDLKPRGKRPKQRQNGENNEIGESGFSPKWTICWPKSSSNEKL